MILRMPFTLQVANSSTPSPTICGSSSNKQQQLKDILPTFSDTKQSNWSCSIFEDA
jgi:hypothetical protein